MTRENQNAKLRKLYILCNVIFCLSIFAALAALLIMYTSMRASPDRYVAAVILIFSLIMGFYTNDMAAAIQDKLLRTKPWYFCKYCCKEHEEGEHTE